MKLKTCSRAMALLLCMVLLLSLAGTAFASVSVTPAYGYVIANTAVNVRTGPNESYSILGWLQQGSYATVTGNTDYGWYQISYNGGYGYVSAAYVNATNVVGGAVSVVPANPVSPVVPVVVADPVVTPVTTTAGQGQSYVSASRLNIRSGPGTRYSVIGTLTRGQVVSPVGRSGNWTQIQLSSGYGYVYSKYISAYAVSTPITNSTPAYNNYSDYCYVTTQLNIRSGAGEQYPIIGYVNAGSIVRRLGTSGGYTRIQVSNSSYTAYVSSSYLIDYLYADAASRVTYPSCYSYNNYYGNYYNYNYYNYRYVCTQCGRPSPTSICPYCGGYCKYNGCGSGCSPYYSSCGTCYRYPCSNYCY